MALKAGALCTDGVCPNRSPSSLWQVPPSCLAKRFCGVLQGHALAGFWCCSLGMVQNVSKPINCPSVWIYLVGWTSIIHLLYLILQTDLAWSQAPLKNWRLDHNKLEFLQRYKFPPIALEIDINHLGVSGIGPMVASTINTREMDSVQEQKTGDDLESRWLTAFCTCYCSGVCSHRYEILPGITTVPQLTVIFWAWNHQPVQV